MNVAGGIPRGKDSGVFLIHAVDDGIERLDGGGAVAYGLRDACGGSRSLTEGCALVSFAGFESLGELVKVGSGVFGVTVGGKFVVERKLADSGGEARALAMRRVNPLLPERRKRSRMAGFAVSSAMAWAVALTSASSSSSSMRSWRCFSVSSA